MGLPAFNPSSDSAARGHLLPQGEKGKAAMLIVIPLSLDRRGWREAPGEGAFLTVTPGQKFPGMR